MRDVHASKALAERRVEGQAQPTRTPADARVTQLGELF